LPEIALGILGEELAPRAEVLREHLQNLAAIPPDIHVLSVNYLLSITA
jgi:hypothetical protein